MTAFFSLSLSKKSKQNTAYIFIYSVLYNSWGEIWCHLYFSFQYIMYLFSLSLFKIFLFITCFEQFDYDVLWYSFLHVSYAWILSRFLHLWGFLFHQIWKILVIISFSKYFIFGIIPNYFQRFFTDPYFRDSSNMFISLLEVVP